MNQDKMRLTGYGDNTVTHDLMGVKPGQYRNPTDIFSEREELNEFVELINSFNITESWEVQVIIARFFYGMTLKDVLKFCKLPSIPTAHRRIRDVVNKIKMSGYKPKKRHK